MSVYFIVWSVSVIIFWLFRQSLNAMEYSIIFLWIILPVTTFVVSFITGRNNYGKKLKWLFPVAYGIMHMLAEYATFSTANMVTFHKFNMPQAGTLLPVTIISFIGIIAGLVSNDITHKKAGIKKNKQ